MTDNPIPTPAAMDAARKLRESLGLTDDSHEDLMALAMDAFAATERERLADALATEATSIIDKAKKLPLGAFIHGGPFDGAPAFDLERVRAQCFIEAAAKVAP